MQIARLQNAKFTSSYGIGCSSIPALGDRDGAYSTFCRISSGQRTLAHEHFEPEIFYIIHGYGLMTIGEQTEKVNQGDLIRIPAFSRHSLENIGSEDLMFLSVYTEDMEIPALPTSSFITSAPPTPNGPLHLGHISGPYLASDILARYLRQRSLSVSNICGTDDHQNYVSEKARILSMPTETFRKQMRSSIYSGFTRMRIEFDEWLEPKTNIAYQNNIKNFVNRALAAKVIEKEIVKFPYCETCQRSLIDATITGHCPCCRESSRGSCESCGIVVPPYDLLNIACAYCKKPATQKSTEVYTFEINKYISDIKAELLQRSLSPRLVNMIEKVSQMQNLKVILSHPDEHNHGLRFPETDQAIHVWFEMAAYYEQFSLSQDFWTHCFGFDNSFHYLLFIPCLLKAMNAQAKLPDTIIPNDFLQLQGDKFSTSRGYAVWVNDVTENIDHLRLYLSLNRPDKKEEDFSTEGFHCFSLYMEKQLQQLNQRASLINDTQSINRKNLIVCNRAVRNMEYYLSPLHLDLRCASRELMKFMDTVLQAENSGKSERLMLHTLAMLMSPFMPQESERLFHSLHIDMRVWVRDWSTVYASA